MIKKYLLFPALFLAGCLDPSPVTSDGSPQETPVKDQNLLAGATSSTNWPTEDGGSTPVQIKVRADSNLSLFFTKFIFPEKISGRVYLYKAGFIPVFDSITPVQFDFKDQDTLSVPISEILALDKDETDSLFFSLKVEAGGTQSLLCGFLFSKKQRLFLRSPASLISNNPPPLDSAKYFLKGLSDSKITENPLTSGRNPQLCFYIPGSPYYWIKNTEDTLFLGPIPYGDFPIRLLRVIRDSVSGGKYRVESFEVVLERKDTLSGSPSSPAVFHLGNRLFSTIVDREPKIRAEIP